MIIWIMIQWFFSTFLRNLSWNTFLFEEFNIIFLVIHGFEELNSLYSLPEICIKFFSIRKHFQPNFSINITMKTVYFIFSRKCLWSRKGVWRFIWRWGVFNRLWRIDFRPRFGCWRISPKSRSIQWNIFPKTYLRKTFNFIRSKLHLV